MDRIDDLEGRVERLESITSQLRSDLAEVKALLPTLTTKEDLKSLEITLVTKFYEGLNGSLQSAINAYPGWLGTAWTAVGSLATVIATGLGIALWLKR